MLLSLAVVAVLAGLSWRYLEGPVIRRARATFRYRTLSPCPAPLIEFPDEH
jgi:peptidoglycan/LPS O-acetylase OafA/YrhL